MSGRNNLFERLKSEWFSRMIENLLESFVEVYMKVFVERKFEKV